MKLRQLEFLLAIVDNGMNVTAAAEALFTSQPGVSKQIRLLEDELGMQLFVRHGKSIDGLTEAGKEVVERARVIRRESDNIKRIAQNRQQSQAGTLSIATTHTQARYVLPQVVKRFREVYPDVNLDLHQGTTEQIAELSHAGHIDLAIASGSDERFGELALLPCYKWDRAVIVPADHELAKTGKDLTLARLAQFPLVTYVFSFDGNSTLKSAFADQGLEPEVVFTARDADVIKTYVRMGLGVGIVASMAQDCEEGSGLTAIDAGALFPRSTTWVGVRRDQVLNRYLTDFVRWFAPHISPELLERSVAAGDQTQVDELFQSVMLPMRGRCAELMI